MRDLCMRLGAWIVAVGLILAVGSAPASALGGQMPTQREGNVGPEVVLVQHLLFQLGWYGNSPDGIFGPATRRAVLSFQRELGLPADGVVGPRTWRALHDSFLNQSVSVHRVRPGENLTTIARRYGTTPLALARLNQIERPNFLQVGTDLLIPGAQAEFSPVGGAELIRWPVVAQQFPVGATATVTDLVTGRSFQVRRWGGRLHADVEPLSARDAEIMREIYGGWSWDRRAIVVDIGGRSIAASMNGMPHGDGALAHNGFPGHFCIHFLGSRVHASGQMDVRHQTMVLASAGYSVTHLWLALGQ